MPAHPLLRLEAALGELLLALTVGRRLPPLPTPQRTTSAPPEDLPALWQQIAALPRDERPRSGLAATLALARGSMWEKLADQYPDLAGESPAPPGFTELRSPAEEPGRLDLVAFFRPPDAGRPILFVLHGLFDSKRAGYAVRAATALAEQGFGVLVPDLRWHGRHLGGSALGSLGLEEAGDLLAWAAWICQRFPGHDLGLLGFSLGAMVVIHTLAADRRRLFRAGGVAFSPAGSLAATVDYVDETGLFARPWGRGVMPWVLRMGMKRRLGVLGIPLARRQPFRALVQYFGERLPAVGDFLLAADPCAALARVRSPLLVVGGVNDPMFPPETTAALGAAGAAARPWVEVVSLSWGGHVACFAASPRWTMSAIDLFFAHSARLTTAGVDAGG
ncbi:MAG TPA: alpha/beta fold hydrolase [Thermoanaerobaculia bacterium]|nr:alpha/beta fold hydrolase [Thermoanaerobaculia bacterium]